MGPVEIWPVDDNVAVEIDNVPALSKLLTHPPADWSGISLQDLDLTDDPDVAEQLRRTVTPGLVVLGGRYPPEVLDGLADGGAVVLPENPAIPFEPYRAGLYLADELYAGLADGYQATFDKRCYDWYLAHTSVADSRADLDVASAVFAAIHDAAISDAFDELLRTDPRPVVAVMGGHGLARGTAGYAEAADLGKTLAQAGYLVATGGGPGAMEAVNLGALVAGRTTGDDADAALRTALRQLAAVPDFTDITRWARVALQIRDALPPMPESTGAAAVAGIGVPTWFYGHEPPNPFADRIAKYFANAIREDILLARASAGVLVLPGAAGTVQEIFQAATRSFYADAAPPIVLLGGEYWRTQLPAWELLRALAERSPRGMTGRVAICDTATQSLQHLSASKPFPKAGAAGGEGPAGAAGAEAAAGTAGTAEGSE